MMVGEVIASIESNAQFTFDYLMLLILAAILAFIGKLYFDSIGIILKHKL